VFPFCRSLPLPLPLSLSLSLPPSLPASATTLKFPHTITVDAPAKLRIRELKALMAAQAVVLPASATPGASNSNPSTPDMVAKKPATPSPPSTPSTPAVETRTPAEPAATGTTVDKAGTPGEPVHPAPDSFHLERVTERNYFLVQVSATPRAVVVRVYSGVRRRRYFCGSEAICTVSNVTLSA